MSAALLCRAQIALSRLVHTVADVLADRCHDFDERLADEALRNGSLWGSQQLARRAAWEDSTGDGLADAAERLAEAEAEEEVHEPGLSALLDGLGMAPCRPVVGEPPLSSTIGQPDRERPTSELLHDAANHIYLTDDTAALCAELRARATALKTIERYR